MTIHTQDPEKQREQLKRYRSGETEEEMNQRVRLHNPITAAILQPTYSYLSYIYRTDGIKRVHESDSPKKPLIEKNFERFYGEHSLHEYLYKAIVYYNKVDPNAWIGFERKNIENNSGGVDRVEIYPVEFPSDQIVSTEIDLNGRVQKLTALRLFSATDAKGHKKDGLKSYFHYYSGGWMRAIEDQGGATLPEANEDNGYTKETILVNKKPVTFWIKEGTNGTKEVPFFCVGAEDHPEHRNKVKCTFTHDSKGLINSLMKDDNFLSVQKTVHCFPDKSEYVKKCKAVNEQGEACHGGYFGGIVSDENFCRSCHGTGKVVSVTEQRVQQLAWPENQDELFELSKLKHYHERPLEIAEMYVREITRQSELIFSTTYNQNNIKPTGQPKTATEVRINADLINNKLTPIAGKIEDGWELAHRIAHQYYEIEGDVEMTHPSDFKVLTVDELIAQYNDATQLPSAVRKSITNDILNKQYRNFPAVKADILAFESWKPWRDKTPEETVIIVSTRAETDFYRQLWENWDMMEQQIKANLSPGGYQPTFYLLTRERQEVEVRKALDQVVARAVYVTAPEPEPLFEPEEV